MMMQDVQQKTKKDKERKMATTQKSVSYFCPSSENFNTH